VTCDITSTDAQGAQCAQQMLNNSAVQVVLEGELLTGEASFIDTMAGTKPVVGVFTNGPGLTAKNSFYVDGAVQGQLAAAPYLAKIVKAKTVAILGPDLPGVAPALAKFKAIFGVLGTKATLELYPAASTDLVGPITASGAESANGVFVVSSTSGECIALAKAFTQLSVTTPVVSLPACLETAVKQGLGDYPEWTYVFTSDNPSAPYAPASDTAAFVDAMARYNNPGLDNSGYAPLTFGTVLTVVKWLNHLGPANYTGAAISKLAASFTGPMFMGDPHIKFGVPPFPTLGSIRALFYTYHGHGSFTAGAGGQWLCPPVPTCQS
jgi:branched-chain amino acid transport system substrate-binding protein